MTPERASILLVGCPEAFTRLVPDHAQAVVGAEDDALTDDPWVVVIGRGVQQPVLAAQRLAHRYREAGVVIVASRDDAERTIELLLTTPFVPIGTRVVVDDADDVRHVMHQVLGRASLRRSVAGALSVASRQLAQTGVQEGLSAPTTGAGEAPLEAGADVVAFFRFYDERRTEIAARAGAVAHGPAALGPLGSLGASPASQHEARLERAAVIHGEWDPYLVHVREQGAALADQEVSVRDWSRLLDPLRVALLDSILADAEDDPGKLADLLMGMDRFLEIVRSAVNEGYVESQLGRARTFDQRERVFASVVESSADAIVIEALDGTVTGWNASAERLYGYTADEALGRRFARLVSPDAHDDRVRFDEHVGEESGPVGLETQHVRKDGGHVDVSLTLSPIRDARGRLVGTSTLVRDISAQLEAAQALDLTTRELARAQRRYRDLYEHAPDAYVSVDASTKAIMECNHTLEAHFGYSRDEIIGKPLLDIYDPACHDDVRRAFSSFLESGAVSNVRLRVRHKDGRSIPVLLTASAARNDDGEILYTRSALRDISEIVSLEARGAAMMDGALDGVVVIDRDGMVVEFNPAAEALFGYTAEQAMGEPLGDLVIPESLRDQHRSGLKRYLETGEPRVLGRRLKLPAMRADGVEFPAEVSIVRLEGIEPPVFAGFIRDLTELERAQASLERTVLDLKRSNEDLEQFAYVASHDLQEPLRMVTSYMQLFKQAFPEALDERAQRYMDYAVDGAKRMKKLLNDLLEYSRVGRLGEPPVRCDVGDIVDGVLQSLEIAVREAGADIRYGELPRIWADSGQLAQVFQNLLSNAIKFAGDVPPVVTIRAEESGEWWRFTVEDNGIGFEAEQADRIFHMFQRLHERSRYGGSGIGLAISKRIVERHGGRIWAEAAPGEGARFVFELPARSREEDVE